MSSIIKGERIRNQSVINLSERFQALHIEYEKDEVDHASQDSISHAINQEIDTTIQEETQEELQINIQEEQINMLLAKANSEAEQIVEEARKQAEAMIAAAQSQSRNIEIDMQTKYAKLLEEANAKTQVILEDATHEAEQIRVQAEVEKQELIKNTENDFTKVLKKLLSHIISEEVFNNTDWLICMVRKMLQECATKEPINIAVSQKVLEMLSETQKSQIKQLGDHITLEARTTLNDTSCLVETKQGNIHYDVIDGLERVISEIQILEKLS